MEPSELTPEVRLSPDFGVEVDAMPGGYVCSASFKGSVDNDEIRRAVAGEGKIPKLFSKAQRAFYETHAPDGLDLGTSRCSAPSPR